MVELLVPLSRQSQAPCSAVAAPQRLLQLMLSPEAALTTFVLVPEWCRRHCPGPTSLSLDYVPQSS